MDTSRLVTLRSEADLLALIPFTLGFIPEDSLVLVTLDRRTHPFHARVDLPQDLGDLEDVAAQLVVAALRNDAVRALVVVYSDDECLADLVHQTLAAQLSQARIDLVTSLRADGSCWFPLGLRACDPDQEMGVPYDIRSHPLTSQSVLDGRVTYGSRDDLAGSLAVADLDVVERVSAACADLPPLSTRHADLVAEGQWTVRRVAELVRAGWPPDVDDLARLLRAVSHRDIRDLAWAEIDQRNAMAHVRLWREVVRRSPEERVAPAAGLLAFAAWLAGDGALSWCAVDRALTADPDHKLARLVARTLEAAMPPSSWRPVDPSALTLYAG